MERDLFSLDAALPYDPFCLKKITDISLTDNVSHRLSHRTWIRHLSRCSAVITIGLLEKLDQGSPDQG